MLPDSPPPHPNRPISPYYSTVMIEVFVFPVICLPSALMQRCPPWCSQVFHLACFHFPNSLTSPSKLCFCKNKGRGEKKIPLRGCLFKTDQMLAWKKHIPVDCLYWFMINPSHQSCLVQIFIHRWASAAIVAAGCKMNWCAKWHEQFFHD